MENKNDVGFLPFCWRVTALHMLSYLIAGLLAFDMVNYQELFSSGVLEHFMRPAGSPVVALGPCLQVILGLVLSLILYRFRAVLLAPKTGWTSSVLLIAGFSVFSPQIPGPGTFEGLIYTKLSLAEHLLGLPETLMYSVLFSTGMVLWYRFPKKIWNILAVAVMLLIFAVSILGYLQATGRLRP